MSSIDVRVRYYGGEPLGGQVRDAGFVIAEFTLDGSTGVITQMYTREGMSAVPGSDCLTALEAVGELPFVQATKFGEVDE